MSQSTLLPFNENFYITINILSKVKIWYKECFQYVDVF
jgi:hypothetical protein